MKTSSKAIAGVIGAITAWSFWRGRGEESYPEAPGVAKSRFMLDQLNPSVRKMAIRVLNKAYASGISLTIGSAYRSSALQDKLYEQGRTAPGPRVTGVRGGHSWHNHRLAFDVAVLKDGRPTWPNDVALWKRIGAIGKSVGPLRWGGDWSTPDYPHFEYRGGLNIQDAIAGRKPKKANLAYG